LHNH
jgi:hypothetical protein